MDGQVLGGGVIVAVAVALWLVYLVPSWQSRHQYNAAERNAVRLNQALRVLAESSETPGEVHLELNARTAAAQQRLARQALAERERAQLEQARAELEIARGERAAGRGERAPRTGRDAPEPGGASCPGPPTRASRDDARRSRRPRGSRSGRVAVRRDGSIRAAVVGGSPRARLPPPVAADVAGRRPRAGRDIRSRGTPRSRRAGRRPGARPRRRGSHGACPRPLVSSAGSRAAAVLDAEAAREALRTAAREEALREQVERAAPPSIDTARVAKAEPSVYSRMGYVDDAEIEEHVRTLLSRVG